MRYGGKVCRFTEPEKSEAWLITISPVVTLWLLLLFLLLLYFCQHCILCSLKIRKISH